jgi:hypothetical protein
MFIFNNLYFFNLFCIAGTPSQDVVSRMMTEASKIDQSQLNQRELLRIFETCCDSDFQSFRLFVK